MSRKVSDIIPQGLKEAAKRKVGRPRVERSRTKLPWFKFWVSEWISDTGLMCCSLATRGLWIEALAHIHKEQEGGLITRSVAQFTQIFRCEAAELLTCLDELASTGTAEITYTRIDEETGEISVDNPVDKHTEKVIKMNLSQFGGNEESYLLGNQIFISILSRRMHREQIHRDTERLRKRGLRAKPPKNG